MNNSDPRDHNRVQLLIALSIMLANFGAAIFVWQKTFLNEHFMSPFGRNDSLPFFPFFVAIGPLTFIGVLAAAAQPRISVRLLLVGVNLLSLASTWGLALLWAVLLMIF